MAATQRSAGKGARLDAKAVADLMAAAAKPASGHTLLVGSEEALVRLLLQARVEATTVAEPGASVVRIAGSDPNAAAVVERASEPTLFGDTTILIVTGLETASEEAVEAVKRIITDSASPTRLIATHSGAARGRGVIKAAEKSETELLTVRPVANHALPSILTMQAKRRGAILTTDGVSELVDALGSDLEALLAAIDQLAQDSPDARIDRDLVLATLPPASTENQFAIADLVWLRKPQEAVVAFRRYSAANGAGTAAVTVVAALSYSLRNLARYVAERPRGTSWQIAGQLGVPGWRVDAIAAQAKLWQPIELARAAVQLAAADAQAKGGLGDAGALDPEQKSYAVERLILGLSGERA